MPWMPFHCTNCFPFVPSENRQLIGLRWVKCKPVSQDIEYEHVVDINCPNCKASTKYYLQSLQFEYHFYSCIYQLIISDNNFAPMTETFSTLEVFMKFTIRVLEGKDFRYKNNNIFEIFKQFEQTYKKHTKQDIKLKQSDFLEIKEARNSTNHELFFKDDKTIYEYVKKFYECLVISWHHIKTTDQFKKWHVNHITKSRNYGQSGVYLLSEFGILNNPPDFDSVYKKIEMHIKTMCTNEDKGAMVSSVEVFHVSQDQVQYLSEDEYRNFLTKSIG